MPQATLTQVYELLPNLPEAHELEKNPVDALHFGTDRKIKRAFKVRFTTILIFWSAISWFAIADCIAQSDTILTKDREGIRFKPENISFHANLLVTQQERVYSSHRFDPSIGRPSFPGFVRQPVGFGYDLSLNYSLVRKKGFLFDLGLGVWSYSLNYKAVEDSIAFIKPNSDIRQYFRDYTVFSLPVSFSYQIRKGFVFGVKTALPIISESKITSPDTTLRYNGNVNIFDWTYLFIEGRIGYEFHINGLRLTPMISFGGLLDSRQRARYLYKAGFTIRYLPKSTSTHRSRPSARAETKGR